MTVVMQTVSKSQLKAQLLGYLRKVEKEKKSLIITHVGVPVVKISPYKQDSQEALKTLRKSVVSYKEPTKPVGQKDWEVLK